MNVTIVCLSVVLYIISIINFLMNHDTIHQKREQIILILITVLFIYGLIG